MVNLPIKLEVPNFTHYGKSVAKCKNGWFEVWSRVRSIEWWQYAHDFIFVFNIETIRLSCTVYKI